MAETSDIIELYSKLKDLIIIDETSKSFKVSNEDKQVFEDTLSKFKRAVVKETIREAELKEAETWIKMLNKAADKVLSSLNAKGIIFSKEMSSFIENPLRHLEKKLFIYTHDLLRGKIELSSYLRTAAAAIRTSFRTNMRSLYQSWVFLTIVTHIAKRLVYPEHGIIAIDRSGKQRTGTIPPNLIIESSKGLISFFIEAPRPIGWEDTDDLARSWRLYTALRPDIMVYGGLVENIIDFSVDPPIKRPDVIIECKELEDWYLRARDVRGPFARPLSAEEWRAKWLEGLWSGLAEALGVEETSLPKIIKERRSIRLKEYRIVVLYKRLYNPHRMFLIARTHTPSDVRNFLEAEGIEVIDDVGFSPEKLINVAKSIEVYARGEYQVLSLGSEAIKLIEEAMNILRGKGATVSKEDIVLNALKHYVRSLKGREDLRGF